MELTQKNRQMNVTYEKTPPYSCFPDFLFSHYYSHKTMKYMFLSLDICHFPSNIFVLISQFYTSVSFKKPLPIMLNCVFMWILGMNLSKTNLSCLDLQLIFRSYFKRYEEFIFWRDIYLYIIKKSFHGTLIVIMILV